MKAGARLHQKVQRFDPRSRRRQEADPAPSDVQPPPDVGGYLLIEALVYIGAVFVLLAVGYVALDRFLDSSVALRRSTGDVAKVLNAGELWRTEVRAAGKQVRLEQTPVGPVLQLTGGRETVAYHFSTNVVLRRVGGGAWVPVLTRVKSSVMEPDTRGGVRAWRWELELRPNSRQTSQIRPLFTFLAVPGSQTEK